MTLLPETNRCLMIHLLHRLLLKKHPPVWMTPGTTSYCDLCVVQNPAPYSPPRDRYKVSPNLQNTLSAHYLWKFETLANCKSRSCNPGFSYDWKFFCVSRSFWLLVGICAREILLMFYANFTGEWFFFGNHRGSFGTRLCLR